MIQPWIRPSARRTRCRSRWPNPTGTVRHRWITGLSVASLGMWMASLTPVQSCFRSSCRQPPRHKIAALGIVTGLGAVSSGLATPLVGALPTARRTLRLGRFRGRRHRWTLGMAVLGAICLVVLGGLTSVAGIALLWVLFSAFQNGEYASLSAAVPDHVPVRQRATVSGWIGMPIALGLVMGTVLVVDILNQDSPATSLAVLIALLAIPFVFMTPDHPLEAADRTPFSWRQLARSYSISPRQYPDFAWAWITRFLASLAIAMGTLYLLYFLEGPVHYRQHFHQPATDGLQTLIIIYTVCVVLTAIIGGMVSDRIGRRKMIVTVSGLLMAAALLLTFGETWRPAGRRGAVRHRIRRLPRGRPGADYPGAAQGPRPGQGPRHHQHRHRHSVRDRPGHRGPARLAAGYPALFGATAVVAIAAGRSLRIKTVR